MANPWTLYDRLIDPIPEDLTVTAASVGPKWCRITSCEGGAGMAFSMPASTRPALHENGEFVGARLRDVAQLAKSWNLAEAGMGMAAVNSWHSLPARARANGFAPCADNNWAKSFHPYREATRGRKVAVIGHFPFAPAALSEAGELFPSKATIPTRPANTSCPNATTSSSPGRPSSTRRSRACSSSPAMRRPS